MPATVAILSNGGMRSLVATAMTAPGSAPGSTPGSAPGSAAANPRARTSARCVLLHVTSLRQAGASRLSHVQRHATRYGIDRVLTIEARQPRPRQADMPLANASAMPAPARAPLATPAMLILAAAHAIDLGADRLIWPAQADGDFDAIARATEQAELVAHLCQLDGHEPPVLETPLLDLTDAQLIDLGEHLGVDWRLAASCHHAGDTPCNACEGCIRRKRAFETAKVIDPPGRSAA